MWCILKQFNSLENHRDVCIQLHSVTILNFSFSLKIIIKGQIRQASVWCALSIVPCVCLLSDALIKHSPKPAQGRKGYLACSSWSIVERNQGRNSRQEPGLGTELKQSSLAYFLWLVLSGVLSLLSSRAQGHLPRDDTHSGLGPPSSYMLRNQPDEGNFSGESPSSQVYELTTNTINDTLCQ